MLRVHMACTVVQVEFQVQFSCTIAASERKGRHKRPIGAFGVVGVHGGRQMASTEHVSKSDQICQNLTFLMAPNRQKDAKNSDLTEYVRGEGLFFS